MTGIIDGVVKLIKTEFGYDLLDALMGFENAPRIINSLLNHSSAILSGMLFRFLRIFCRLKNFVFRSIGPGSQDFPKCVKESCMHFLLMMMTSTEILSKNKLMEYVVTNSSLLECLFLLLSQTDTRIGK